VEAGISTVLLKGADLAYTLYSDPGLRPMSDLDILVPYSSYNTALQLVEQKLNYHREPMDTTQELRRVISYHTSMRGGINQYIKLELHWTLVASELSWYAAPVGWFWKNTLPYHAHNHNSNEKVLKLSTEANLLYLCAHAMLQHGGRQCLLIWIYDIHALVTKNAAVIRWEWLSEEAHRLGWTRVLLAGLRASQASFGTQIPEGVLHSLGLNTDQRLDRLLEFKAKSPKMRLLYDWYTLISLRWPDRIRYAAILIFPGRAYILRRYHPQPVWIWPVYYLYRWGRMFGDAIGVLREQPWR
jgi:hypothetical protein